MFKQHRTTLIISSILILLPIAAGLLLWHKLPQQVPIHWNAAGTIDGYGSKPFAVLAIPAILLAVHWLCVFITSLDKKSKEQSKKVISLVLWIIPCISIVVQSFVLTAALGYSLDITFWMCILMGVMFLIIGNYLPKCPQNKTIGIKIKWTLTSEKNWNATHRFAGKAWVAGGFGFFLCLLTPSSVRFIPAMALIAVLILLPFAYSYRYHKKNGTS